MGALAATKSHSGLGSLRIKFFQCAGALAIVAAVVPFFLEEDVEDWVVHTCIGVAVALAVFFAMFGACLPAAPPTPVISVSSGAAQKRVSALEERGHLLQLVEKQRAKWSGDQPASWALSQFDSTNAPTDVSSSVRRRGNQTS